MGGQPDPELDETLVPILCPRCGRNDGCTSIGREQLVCVCLWCAGENLLTVPLDPGEMKWDAIVRALEADSRRHPVRYLTHKLIRKAKIQFSKFCRTRLAPALTVIALLQLVSRNGSRKTFPNAARKSVVL